MKKSSEARLTRIEDMIQIIHDHLMELHRIAEDALIAETTSEKVLPPSIPLPHLLPPLNMN